MKNGAGKDYSILTTPTVVRSDSMKWLGKMKMENMNTRITKAKNRMGDKMRMG